MYNPAKHGRAEYGHYMQIPNDELSNIIEGDDSIALLQQRFALLTYQVNSTPVQISGGLSANVTSVGLDANGTVQLSGDQLKVFDQLLINKVTDLQNIVVGLQSSVDVLSSQLIQNNYSRIIQERGTDIYFAHAEPGTSEATSAWRVQKVDDYGNRQWADNGNFSQPANIELSALVYTY